MSNDASSPPSRGGLSLYANLLDGGAPGTISSAPVTYSKPTEANVEQDEAAKKQQAIAASLRFQPTKRPQLAAQKAKAKAIASKFAPPVASTVTPTTVPQPVPEAKADAPTEAATQAATNKLSAADWTATLSEDEDVTAYYASTKQRRKKRKKNKEPTEIVQDWDDIYDPSRPNDYEEYKRSEEKIREVREWKDLLYRHRIQRRHSSDYDSDGSEKRPMNKQFAPPPSMSFAPPSNLNNNFTPTPPPPPPPPPTELPDDPTGEDAYMRRLRLSQQSQQQLHPPLPPPSAQNLAMPTPPPPPPTAAAGGVPASQISRAPVRYNLPPPPSEIPSSEAELEAKLASEDQIQLQPQSDLATTKEPTQQSRSNRPGQKGFAERLLTKYGWTKGSGLGAQGTGIVNPLYAKVDKRKKLSDAEGGGFAGPTTAKILGGTKAKSKSKNNDVGNGKTEDNDEDGKFGAMSEVVKLSGMLKGMNVIEELTRTDQEGTGGGLMQEIGEECGEKYGSVERVYIHTERTADSTRGKEDGNDNEDDDGAVVFVKFVSQLSALRAVNALEGRVFNGNTIRARFWDREKFEDGRYD